MAGSPSSCLASVCARDFAGTFALDGFAKHPIVVLDAINIGGVGQQDLIKQTEQGRRQIRLRTQQIQGRTPKSNPEAPLLLIDPADGIARSQLKEEEIK
jgi:hypothetical protein